MIQIVFATNNQNKLEEVQAQLPEGIKLISLKDIGCYEDIPETQKTIEGNAIQKDKEAALILNKISSTDRLFLFDEHGITYNSVEFSKFLQKQMNSGIKQLVFVIGGPYGFSEVLHKKAVGKISLSKMTFSHQMVRLFVLEQIYRGFTILKNEPYHHQ